MKAKIKTISKVLVSILIILLLTNCGSGKIKKARELIDLKLYDQAIEMLSLEIKNDVTNHKLYFEIGNAYWGRAVNTKSLEDEQRIENILNCQKSYENALKIKPDDESTLYNLGVLLSFRGGRGSISNLEKIIKLNPNHIGANTFLGRIYGNRENIESSNNYLKKSLDLQAISKKWEKVNFSSVDKHYESECFIVIKDSASIFSAEDDKEITKLNKYYLTEDYETKDDKLYFDYYSYTDKIGWSYSKPKEWGKSRYFNPASWYNWEALVFHELPPISDKEKEKMNETESSFFYDWLGKCKDNYSYDILDRDEQKTAELTGNFGNHIEIYRYAYWNNRTVNFNEIKYQLISQQKSWINSKDVLVDVWADYDVSLKVQNLKNHTFWEDEVSDKILRNYFCKGMTYDMLSAAIGIISRSKIYPSGNDIFEIFTSKGMEFIFKNGRLFEWSEKNDGNR